jgi:hypothetical protein
MKTVDDKLVIDKEYNTTTVSLPVLEGLEVDESVVTQYSDLIEQWREKLFGGIGSKETEAKNNILKAQTNALKAIELKKDAALKEVPEDLTTAYNLAVECKKTKADAIECVAEGSNISVSDSSDDHIRGLRVFGKTTQIKTTGKNLLPANPSAFGIRNGVRFTDLGDGRIGVIGNASANTTFVFCPFEVGTRTPISAGTYTLSGSPGASVFLSLYVYESQDATEPLVYNASLCAGKTWTFTLDNDAYYGAYLYIGKGKGPNEIVSPQLERGSTVTTFEPCSGGRVSPRPDYPRELINVGNGDNINVWVTGKNLLRDVDFPKTTTKSGITCDYEGDGIFHVYGTFTGTVNGIELSGVDINIPIDPDSKYTMTATLLSGQPPYNFHPYLGVSSNTTPSANWLATKIGPTTSIGDMSIATTTGRSHVKDATTIKRFWIYSHNDNLTAYTMDFRFQVWFEKGDVSTEFEPYVEYLASAPTPNGLPGIPVDSDGNYTDSSGQQWVCDEIDFERGVYINRIGTKRFTGTELLGDYISPNGAVTTNLQHKPNTNFLCTHAINWDAMTWANDEYMSFNVDKFGVSSVAELTDLLLAWNDAGNPLTVLFVRRDPVETKLTADEIKAFEALRSNRLTTKVFNDSGAHMELKYNVDTKTYLDNSIKHSITNVMEAIVNGSY